MHAEEPVAFAGAASTIVDFQLFSCAFSRSLTEKSHCLDKSVLDTTRYAQSHETSLSGKSISLSNT
jgi:hypothetical protein